MEVRFPCFQKMKGFGSVLSLNEAVFTFSSVNSNAANGGDDKMLGYVGI